MSRVEQTRAPNAQGAPRSVRAQSAAALYIAMDFYDRDD